MRISFIELLRFLFLYIIIGGKKDVETSFLLGRYLKEGIIYRIIQCKSWAEE